MMKLAEILDRPFEFPGRRGDSELLVRLTEAIGDLPLPETEQQLVDLLVNTCSDIAGEKFLGDKVFYVADLNPSMNGMSGGRVSPKTWRKSIIPMISARWATAAGNPSGYLCQQLQVSSDEPLLPTDFPIQYGHAKGTPEC